MQQSNYKKLYHKEKAKATEYFNKWQQSATYLKDAIEKMKEHNKISHPTIIKPK